MTLDELIARLEEVREELGNGTGQVIIRNQPNYPLTQLITSVVTNRDVILDFDEDEPGEPTKGTDDLDVWIAVDQPDGWGNISPYAPAALWS